MPGPCHKLLLMASRLSVPGQQPWIVCLRYQALWMLCRAIQGRAECPICRAPLKPGDLFDAATAEEEESQRLLNENMGNYGAKVLSSDP